MDDVTLAGEDAGEGDKVVLDQVRQSSTNRLLTRFAELHRQNGVRSTFQLTHYGLGGILAKALHT